jgi:uncharacterized damage-inducible protein DinB
MITPQQLAEAFGRNVAIAQMQAKGLSHEDSLRQLPFRGNCLNWVLGHMLASREDILGWLGHDALAGERVARYRRESDPVTVAAEDVLPLDELLALLAASQEKLAAALATISDESLDREVLLGTRSAPLRQRLFFLYFHDTYHVGQTELLRQLAGVDDKVI